MVRKIKIKNVKYDFPALNIEMEKRKITKYISIPKACRIVSKLSSVLS